MSGTVASRSAAASGGPGRPARAPAAALSGGRAPGGGALAPLAPLPRRVAHLLGTIDLEPPGLPAGAVLVVRRLRDPLPGGFLPDAAALRAGPAWEGASRAALAALARSAARPALGPVGGDAAAVLFADHAELLACLARDLARGRRGRWWWRALLRDLPEDAPAALAAALERDAAFVPAALARLAADADAAPVVAALPSGAARRILAAVAGAFGLSRIDGAEAPPAARPPDGAGAAPAPRAPPPAALAAGALAAPPPWLGVVAPAEAPPRLAPEQRALVGVALTLARAPALARSPRFAAGLRRWLADAAGPPPAADSAGALPGARAAPGSGPASRPHAGAPVAPSAPAPAPARTRPRNPAGAEANVPGDGAGEAAAAEAGNRRAGARATARAPALPPQRTPRPGAVSGEGAESSMATPGAQVGRPAPAAAGPAPAPASDLGLRARGSELSATTKLGGVLFLVNALRTMDFWRSLERDLGIESQLGGWAWLELVARALLRPRARAHAGDALWRVLALLDGRAPGESARLDVRDPVRCPLPGAWRRGREPVRGVGEVPASGGDVVHCVVDVLRRDLRIALGLADAAEVSRGLLLRAGRLDVSATHVELVLSLEQASVPVRLAGLDADPGWVPELGRVVLFHFVREAP